MTLGLALGSGGARGWCHIGVLQELDAMGIRPDVAAGCSMGALVGAAWAGGRLDALADWATGLTRSRVMRLLDVRLSGGGLVQGGAIAQIIEEIGLPDDFSDLEKPFLAVATDMTTGQEIWLREGSLCNAVRGSMAMPGVFAPFHHEGRWLLDGGMVNPVPSSACRALGADTTLAVNPNGAHDDKLWVPAEPSRSFWRFEGLKEWADILPEGLQKMLPEARKDERPVPPDYLDVVSTSMDIMSRYLRQTRLASDPPQILLEADLRQTVLVLELEKAGVAIEAGRELVRAQADDIRAVCGGKGQ